MLALVPWLADWGYFMAIDVQELGGIIPQAQTYIVTVGCICAALVSAEKNGTDEVNALNTHHAS